MKLNNQIKSINKFIAKFDGAKIIKLRNKKEVVRFYYEYNKGQIDYNVDELDYHSNWNSLMRVIEKIELIEKDSHSSRDNFHIYIGKRHIRIIYDWDTYSVSDKKTYIEIKKSFKDYRYVLYDNSKIKATFFAVYDFLKWYKYNKNKKNK